MPIIILSKIEAERVLQLLTGLHEVRLLTDIEIQIANKIKKELNEELKDITPTNEELIELAENNPAPQEWYDEDAS
jgi:hypothetical protein